MTVEGRKSMVDAFGEENVEGYTKLLKATKGLVDISRMFYRSEPGSLMEQGSREALEMALMKLHDRPDKAIGMIHSLLALLNHLEIGGSTKEWFAVLEEE